MKTVKRTLNISFKKRKPTSDEFKIPLTKYNEKINLEVTINLTDKNQQGTYYFNNLNIKSKSIHCYIKPDELIDKLRWSPVRPDKEIINKAAPLIFLRIAWMKNYKGVKADDIPTGAGSHIRENSDGGEVYNFLPIKGHYYGFSRIQKRGNLRLERLKVLVQNNQAHPVTVILFAKHPTGGEFIVGWYKQATLHRNLIQILKGRKDKPFYLFKTEVENAKLIPEDKRIFELPTHGPGQSNVWYVQENADKRFLEKLEEYLSNPDAYVEKKRGRPFNTAPWQQDAETRKKVELAAMKKTLNHFTQLGYHVTDVHTDNLGWDMEARIGEQTLLLEVKGLSGKELTVELSANEYAKSKQHKKNYRICIVNNTLDKKRQQLHVFAHIKGKWKSSNGLVLKDTPKTAAIFRCV